MEFKQNIYISPTKENSKALTLKKGNVNQVHLSEKKKILEMNKYILNWYLKRKLDSIPARSKFPFHSLKTVMDKVFNIKPWSWAKYWIGIYTWLAFYLSRKFSQGKKSSECTFHSALLFTTPWPPRSFLSWNAKPKVKLNKTLQTCC